MINEEQRREIDALMGKIIATMPPVTVEAYDESTGEPRTWFYATVAELSELKIREADDAVRLAAVASVQVARWSRAWAAARRVWQVRDRHLRQWQAAQIVAAQTPPEGAGEGEKAWKAPAMGVIEARFRAHPEYARLYTLVERAEEATNACLGFRDAWQGIVRLFESVK